MLVVICLAAAHASAFAGQASGPVAGVVIDASGAPVAGASVTVEVTGKPARTVETGVDGRFSLDEATCIEGTLRVRASGFAQSVTPLGSDVSALRVVLQPRPLTESVTVTASRGATGVDTAASATIVSSAELLTSAAGAIDDALRNTPGFSLFRRSSSRVANPTTQGVTLRGVSGSGASRTLVVADGWALNDPFGSWVYWNRIPLAAVDRIEVVRGTTGDLYGADALGGVIQVLTLDAERPRLRGLFEAGSHDTYRASGFGGRRFGNWALSAGAEGQNTDGVYIVAEEVRGAVDVPAYSDYGSGFAAVGYGSGAWRATLRANFASESRGNGTPVQVNDTDWRQFAGDVNGSLAGGFWTARVTGGTQDYFQTFSTVAADRQTERLTSDQTIPGDFVTAGGQWMRTWKAADVLVGVEGRQTTVDLYETRYPVVGAPVSTSNLDKEEQTASVYGRVRFALRPDLSLVVGARGDHWKSTDSLSFFSPRASLTWRANDLASLQFSVARSYRTPTLNELYRGFRVGNVAHQPQSAPRARTADERRGRRARRPRPRVGPSHGVPQRARRCDLEHHADVDAGTDYEGAAERGPARVVGRGSGRRRAAAPAGDDLALRGLHLGALHQHAEAAGHPGQPRAAGTDLSIGTGVIAETPRVATFSVQARFVGSQYDDDLNEFLLENYVVVDASASRPLTRAVHLFLGFENLFDVEYDVARTPVRSIGWPFTVRAGVRVFLP